MPGLLLGYRLPAVHRLTLAPMPISVLQVEVIGMSAIERGPASQPMSLAD
jgi:hypothetical protein